MFELDCGCGVYCVVFVEWLRWSGEWGVCMVLVKGWVFMFVLILV